MVELAAFFAVAFVALFVVVEPFGVVPVFASLTHGRWRARASMATVMVLLSSRGDAGSMGVVIAAVLATFLLSFLVLQSAGLFQRMLGRATMAVVQRVLGLFLAAMSIQFMAQGARALLA